MNSKATRLISVSQKLVEVLRLLTLNQQEVNLLTRIKMDSWTRAMSLTSSGPFYLKYSIPSKKELQVFSRKWKQQEKRSCAANISEDTLQTLQTREQYQKPCDGLTTSKWLDGNNYEYSPLILSLAVYQWSQTYLVINCTWIQVTKSLTFPVIICN